MKAGLRGVNILRLFNLRNGITPDLDGPSVRLGSTAMNGPAKGRSILEKWNLMLKEYYETMGWDKEGKPRFETLRSISLEHLIPDIEKQWFWTVDK